MFFSDRASIPDTDPNVFTIGEDRSSTYPTLSGAFEDLRFNRLSSPIVLRLVSDITDTGVSLNHPDGNLITIEGDNHTVTLSSCVLSEGNCLKSIEKVTIIGEMLLTECSKIVMMKSVDATRITVEDGSRIASMTGCNSEALRITNGSFVRSRKLSSKDVMVESGSTLIATVSKDIGETRADASSHALFESPPKRAPGRESPHS